MNLCWLADSLWPRSVDSTLDKVIFIGCIIASIVGIGMLVYLYQRSWRTGFLRTRKRLKAGHVSSELAHLNYLHDHGDSSFKTLLRLLLSYLHDGRAAEAAAIADELETAFARETKHMNTSSQEYRVMRDLLKIGRYDATVSQGDFIRAAQDLSDYVGQCLKPFFAAELIAFAYHLARDDEHAAHIICQFPPKVTWRTSAYWIFAHRQMSPNYRFLLAYLQHALCGHDKRRALHRMRARLDYWEDEAARNAANPYGQRLSEILADVRRVMEQ